MITKDEFIQHFAEQFEKTDASAFTSDTHFRDLEEWSSLTGLSVITMVDDECNVVLRGDAMKRAETIGELYEVVKSLS